MYCWPHTRSTAYRRRIEMGQKRVELAQRGECVMNVSEVLAVSVSVASVCQEERWLQGVYARRTTSDFTHVRETRK